MRGNYRVSHFASDIQMAIRMIRLGARLHLLQEAFPNISRERLIGLHYEIQGEAPARGMLPFSSDWFKRWQPSVHSSIFVSYYLFFKKHGNEEGVELLLKAYEFYLLDVSRLPSFEPASPLLSLSRAWNLIKFMQLRRPELVCHPCTKCGGIFVVYNDEPPSFYNKFVCGLCVPPGRAGKKNTKKSTG